MYFQFMTEPFIVQLGDVVQVPVEYVPGYNGPIYVLGDGVPMCPAYIVDAANPDCVGVSIQHKPDAGVIYFTPTRMDLVVRGYPV